MPPLNPWTSPGAGLWATLSSLLLQHVHEYTPVIRVELCSLKVMNFIDQGSKDYTVLVAHTTERHKESNARRVAGGISDSGRWVRSSTTFKTIIPSSPYPCLCVLVDP